MNFLRIFLRRPAMVLLIRHQHSKTLKHFAKQIDDARRAHRAVRHLEQARRDYIHSCLGGGRR